MRSADTYDALKLNLVCDSGLFSAFGLCCLKGKIISFQVSVVTLGAISQACLSFAQLHAMNDWINSSYSVNTRHACCCIYTTCCTAVVKKMPL